MLPEVAPLAADRDVVRRRRSGPVSPQVADDGSPPGTSRVAVAPRAETARPAASATAGSSASGVGVPASRLLKSASAS